MSRKKLAICVPYRNREQHLEKFIPHMDNFFKNKDIDYKIFICNQVDNKKFNRGKTKNIAFDIARKEGYDYFAFHDIDLLPMDESCDYTFPKDGPQHLSAYLSMYDYKLLFPENFGGVVLFTKEQFEAINGYYNDYWDWGAEDDDLFYRCKINGFTNRNEISSNKDDKMTAVFSGEKSYLQIDCKNTELGELMSNSYTMQFLVKPHKRDDVLKYLIGKSDTEFIHLPILNRYNLETIGYSNTGSFESFIYNEENELNQAWAKRDEDVWTNLIIRVDTKKRTHELLINGMCLDHCNKTDFIGELRSYYSSPYFIGKIDGPVWSKPSHKYFKGEIAQVCFWNRALTDMEISKYKKESYVDSIKKGLILSYDFEEIVGNKIVDLSGNGNDGTFYNVKFVKQDIGKVLNVEYPRRRYGKFMCLDHKSEGIKQGAYQNEDSCENEKILEREVKSGILNTQKNGLNNLCYKIIRKKTLSEKHLIIDVNC